MSAFKDWYKFIEEESNKLQLPRPFELPDYKLYCDETHRVKGTVDVPLYNLDPERCKSSWAQLDDSAIRTRSISWLRDTLVQRQRHNESYRAASDVNLHRIQRVMHKLQTGQNVSIFVLGGSLPQGVHVGGIYGAYSKILENALNERYRQRGFSNNASVKITNKAVGGTTTLWALHQISIMLEHEASEPIDLVTIDYDVNDCATMRSDLASDQNEYIGYTEYLLREVLEHETLPAVLFVNNAITHSHSPRIIGDCNLYHTCYALGELRRPILDAYQIPLISQKKAIWHNFTCPPPEWRWSCHGFCSHPNANGHQLISSILFGFLTGESFANDPLMLDYYNFVSSSNTNAATLPQSQSQGSTNTLSEGDQAISVHDEEKLLMYPSHPLYAYTQELDDQTCTHSYHTYIGPSGHTRKNYLSQGSKPVRGNKKRHLTDESKVTNADNLALELDTFIAQRDPCWTYKEDVKGKPGWIVDEAGCVGSTIIFNVTFGNKPFLNVVFLSTYNEHFGDLLVELAPNTHSYTGNDLRNTSKAMKWSWLGIMEGYHGPAYLYSMSDVFVFQAHKDAAHQWDKHHHTYVVADAMRANADYLVRMTLMAPKERAKSVDESIQPWKFKVISLATC